jgi:glycosyltransferase A (GT-A) superfamily protein (DUF2064 family)
VTLVPSVVVLDGGRADAVGELLEARARALASSAFDDAPRRADPGEGLADVLRAQGDEPIVVINPALPVWPGELAADALSDLDAGCALAIGPIFDGGFYLFALAAPVPGLAELSEDELTGRHAMNALIALTARDELQVGLLRTQRGLRTDADVRALLADPLTDEELRGLLE